jgi:hypothetical protein
MTQPLFPNGSPKVFSDWNTPAGTERGKIKDGYAQKDYIVKKLTMKYLTPIKNKFSLLTPIVIKKMLVEGCCKEIIDKELYNMSFYENQETGNREHEMRIDVLPINDYSIPHAIVQQDIFRVQGEEFTKDEIIFALKSTYAEKFI